MDASKIVVLVLTLISIGFLVWIELNSRRNTKALEKQTQPPPESEQRPTQLR